MKKLFQFLRVIVTPSCWVQIHHHSKSWDEELQSLMSQHQFEKHPGFYPYIAKLGDQMIWVANHPYASMSPVDIEDVYDLMGHMNNIRPSRWTILVAGDKYKKEIGV